MRFCGLLPSAVPVEIQVLIHECNAEAQFKVLKVNVHLGVFEAFHWRSLRDGQLSITEGHLLNVPGLQLNLAIYVDLPLKGNYSYGNGIRLIIAIFFYSDPHVTEPGDFLSARVPHKLGIHVDFPVTNEVEYKTVLSLHRVAEHVSIRHSNAEMWVITDTYKYNIHPIVYKKVMKATKTLSTFHKICDESRTRSYAAIKPVSYQGRRTHTFEVIRTRVLYTFCHWSTGVIVIILTAILCR